MINKGKLTPIILLTIGIFIVLQLLLIQENVKDTRFVYGIFIVISEGIELFFMGIGLMFLLVKKNFFYNTTQKGGKS